MCINDSFNKVYSGGKDCKIYATDLANPEDSILVCEETAPVLSVRFSNRFQLSFEIAMFRIIIIFFLGEGE